MADVIYNGSKNTLMKGGIDLVPDTIKVAFFTNSYMPT
jgi:hypothetical protein